MKNKNIYSDLVTVYITNYNYGSYIEEAINSVLDQTYDNFELIIIDDGSTDDSKTIINKYIENSKVRIIFQENKGLSVSNNVALKAANGNFIMRLDADDYLDQNCLLLMVNKINEDNINGMVFPDYYYVDQSGHITGQERRNNFEKDVILLDQPAHGACTLIRREFLLEVGGYSNEFDRQDGWDVWLKFIERYKVKNINLPLFYYRRHEENLTNNTQKLLETRSKIYKKHAEESKKKNLNVLAVLSVRGKTISNNSQELSILGNKPVICWTIDNVLSSSMIQELIISTSDQEIIDFINTRYNKSINIVRREIEKSLENISHEYSLKESIKKRKIDNYDAVMEITPDYPLRNYFYMEKAINVMRVHDVDRVIGVIPEDSVIYKHNGSGLEMIGNNIFDNKLRLEREYIYRHTGGISLSKKSYFESKNDIKKKPVQGHIIMSAEASTKVNSKLELEIANIIIKNYKQ
tara:strand:+ start:85 stop:1479 length:1395 start_codon:yes stop_codon:yes gene_type:complete